MIAPTPPREYAHADIRLIAVDMDGTLLDDKKNFPPDLEEILGELDARGITFAPASGRQAWTLLDMFPSRPGMTVIGENGAIVLRDTKVISTSPLDAHTVREAILSVRRAVESGLDGGLVLCGANSAYVERHDALFVDGVMPYYHRTRKVTDQLAIVDAIESGELEDAIIKLAVHSIGPVADLAHATLARFAGTHQYAVSGKDWADLQIQGVEKGTAVRALQERLGITSAQTACFGDFHNDLSMLAEADYSFAMANAHPDVRAAARFVAPSNNEAGVTQVIRALLGGA